MKAIEIQSPNKIVVPEGYSSMFLAGSIEMGIAEDWQKIVQKQLFDKEIVFLNPRRYDWDASWEQTIENPKFKEQVEWELNGLDQADVIFMYFDPATKSPISLLELGLHANSSKMMVCCPEGFWRKGNVDIICERYGITQFDSLNEIYL
tara:strand:- start:808 stop:1254 length:447 start_codon:yes stop_codon:yes gene_type:complete